MCQIFIHLVLELRRKLAVGRGLQKLLRRGQARRLSAAAEGQYVHRAATKALYTMRTALKEAITKIESVVKGRVFDLEALPLNSANLGPPGDVPFSAVGCQKSGTPVHDACSLTRS